MIKHAVVLTFPDNIKEELSQLRKDYAHYVSYTIEPHLTLKQPFISKVDITIIEKCLKEVTARTKPFTLRLSGIEYFEEWNNVAYIALINKQPVIDLHTDIVLSLKELVKDLDRVTYELDKFTPHVSISELIPDDIFPTVKKIFSNYSLSYECEIESFFLFSSDEEKIWKSLRTFKLTGT